MERANRFIADALLKLPYTQSFVRKDSARLPGDKCKVKLISWEDNRATFEFKVEKEHCNLNDVLHGGMATTLVDLYSAVATSPVYKTDYFFISTELKMRFLAPAKLGETVLLDARVLKAGKMLAYTEMEILNKATKKLLVQGTHTMFLVERGQSSPDVQ